MTSDRASGGAWGSRVHVGVVIRVSERQPGSIVRGSVQVRECVVVSVSRQALEATRKSRDEIRLGEDSLRSMMENHWKFFFLIRYIMLIFVRYKYNNCE